MRPHVTPRDIIDFWFSDEVKSQWFSASPEFDKALLEKYEALWESASIGDLDGWADDADGCLALVIIPLKHV